MVRRQSSAGHDAVDVGVPLQSLAPRMQDAEEADIGAETGWIGCNFQQRSSTGLEQQAEQDLLVLPNQWHQSMWGTEDQVKVVYRQQFLLPGAQPLLPRIGLALRTVAVPAGNGEIPITCLGLNRFAVFG